MTGKKVILFVDSLESGGAQRQIIVLANVLYERGYDVVILTYYPGDQLSQFLASGSIRRRFVPRHSKYDIGFFFRLSRYFRSQAPDCIISYLTTTNFWARTAGRLAGINHIITSERSLTLRPGLITTLRERFLARLSSAIVVNSQESRRSLRRIGIPSDKTRVIYNGLDYRLFSRQPAGQVSALRESLGISASDFLVLLPGRISAEKNHLLLVEAALRFDPAMQTIKVAFAGNEFYGDVKQRIAARIAVSGVADKFLFLGPRTDMPLLYSAADVVVLPSLWEGFPNVIVEAMACGTPVIASDISDNALLIEQGSSGYLFGSDNAAQLFDALNAVLRMSREQRRKMGARGAERAASLCSLETFGNQYCALIEHDPSAERRAPVTSGP